MDTIIKREPWMKFWFVDWQAMTQTCSAAAKGVAIDMMCHAHKHGVPYGHLATAAHVPMPDGKLARLANTSVREFRDLMDELVAADVFARDASGVLYSPYLVLRQLRRTQKQTAGSAGGRASWTAAQASGQASAQAVEGATARPSAQAPAGADAQSTAQAPVASSFLLLASGFSSSPQNSDLSFEGARGLLTFLNEKASADFRESPAVLHEIALRLHEVGGDLEGVRTMVTRQCALWKSDPKMSRFLRPTTLFDPVKFHEYFGQRNIPVQPGDAQPDGTVRVNAAAVNGRLMTITRRLAEIEDSPLPEEMSERRALKREQAVLTEQQRKAAGL